MDVLRVKRQFEELELILESLRRPLDLRTKSLLQQKFRKLINLIKNEIPEENLDGN